MTEKLGKLRALAYDAWAKWKTVEDSLSVSSVIAARRASLELVREALQASGVKIEELPSGPDYLDGKALIRELDRDGL